MLQIIRGKLVIFLITLCLFVVYLGFDNNSNSDIVFYGHKTPKSVEIYLSEKNIIYKIINDQKISRGNGHFISIMVNNYRTHCGVVDINLNFFISPAGCSGDQTSQAAQCLLIIRFLLALIHNDLFQVLQIFLIII